MKFTTVILNLVLVTLCVASEPQKHALSDEMPLNPAVRTGTLENGFTYYIQDNKKPEQRVEMRLAVNAGSILEDEDQQGLAHFCEHMAFNGTKHFEKNELVSFLQSIGVKFGPDINAYTSFDETVYMLTIPSDKMELVDQGFVVMRDWADGVSYDTQQIDDERGVIVEEWRMGRGASQRIRDEILPVLLKDSHYAERLPIGKLDVIEHCEHDALRRFYREWYRPELMALIVVGDVDVEYVEEKIKAQFSDMKVQDTPRIRDTYDVPEHEETLVKIATDPEASQVVIQFNHKFDKVVDQTVSGFLNDLRFDLYTSMLNMRMFELSQQAEPPFIYSGFYFGQALTRGLEAYVSQTLVAPGGIEKGFIAMLTENKRAAEGGFTEAELTRAKADMLSSFEKQYAERDKTESARFAARYVNHFLEDSPAPGIQYHYEVVKQYLAQIELKEVNALAQKLRDPKNRVFMITGPELVNDEITEDRILQIVEQVDGQEVEAYVEEEIASELISKLPAAGSVVSTEYLESIDAKHLVLSNGVNVYLKKTDFKNDEILFRAYSNGGRSLTDLEDKYSVQNADLVMDMSGVGDFSAMDLNKFLAGKQVQVGNSIGASSEAVSGSCRPQDLEEFFQLIHLAFSAPRKDEAAFSSIMSRFEGYLQNIMQNPNTYFQDKYTEFYSQNHPRAERVPRPEELQHVDHDRIIEIYKERFADADDFIFVFVGSFEEEKLVPLLEQYVASLNSLDGSETWTDHNIRPPEGKKILEVYKGQDEKSMTILDFWTPIEFTEERGLMLRALGQYLNIRLNEVLREEMGGVYSISAQAGLHRVPWSRAFVSINIPSSPDNVEKLVGAVVDILKDVSENGVSAENIDKIKEILKRDKEVKLKQNRPWLNDIIYCARWNRDFSKILDMEHIDTITSENIQKVFNECFDPEVYLQSTLYPESMKPE